MSALPVDAPPESPGAGLRGRLLRLRRPAPLTESAGRALAGARPRAVASLLLTEIDETILPRRLTLSLSNGKRLGLIVAGRRVLALSGPPESWFAAPDEAAEAVQAALKRALSATMDVRLTATRLPPLEGRPAIGCDAALLAAHIGLPEWAAARDGGAQDAMAALSRHADAWVRLAAPGQAVAQGGAADTGRELIALSHEMGDDLDPLLNAALGGRRNDGCVFLGGPDDAGGVLVVRGGGQITLARVSAGAWARLAPRFDAGFARA